MLRGCFLFWRLYGLLIIVQYTRGQNEEDEQVPRDKFSFNVFNNLPTWFHRTANLRHHFGVSSLEESHLGKVSQLLSHVQQTKNSFQAAYNGDTGAAETLMNTGNFLKDISQGSGISGGCLGSIAFLSLSMTVFATAAKNEINCARYSNCSKLEMDIYLGEMYSSAWSIEALDAMGKIPAGISLGNTRWLGEWDQCWDMKIPKHGNTKESGMRYCAANVNILRTLGNHTIVPPKLPHEDPTTDKKAKPDPLHPNPFEASFAVLGGQFPFIFGFCVPATCTVEDVYQLANLTHIETNYIDCHEQHLKVTTEDHRAVALLAVISVFLLLISAGTVLDLWAVYFPDYFPKLPKKAVALFVSFSFYTNTLKLFNTEQKEGQIHCIHGLRFLSMAWVALGHTYAFAPTMFDNMLTFADAMTKGVLVNVITNATVSVDSFFVMSGFLLAYLFLKETDKTKGKKLTSPYFWFLYYFHRYIRLSAPYFLIMGVEIALGRYVSNGPSWPQKEGFEDDFCKKTWWQNVLYLNNFGDYFQHDQKAFQCFGHSWYLANDMQFHWFAPPLLLAFWYTGLFGLIPIACLLLISTSLRAWETQHYHLPPGLTVASELNPAMQRLMSDMYLKPWMRCGPYLVGMAAGYLLYYCKGKLKLNRLVTFLGWSVNSALMLSVLLGLYDYNHTYTINQQTASFYAAVHRSVWGLGVCWIIFACATKNGGWIDRFLSWKLWIPLSRLSYCAYLVHPILIYVDYTSAKTPMHFNSHLTMVILFMGHLFLSYFVAYLGSMAFEAPILGIERVLLPRETNGSKRRIQEEGSEVNVENPNTVADEEEDKGILDNEHLPYANNRHSINDGDD